LTFSKDYADICGFTVYEFDELFQENMESWFDEFIYLKKVSEGATVANLREAIHGIDQYI
jgi:hypothetical protein